MQFTLSADGILKHHCSGKMICPRKPAKGKWCELMISNRCHPQDAKFERTAGRTKILLLDVLVLVVVVVVLLLVFLVLLLVFLVVVVVVVAVLLLLLL